MTRKKTRRKHWGTPAIPILFSLQKAGLTTCRLLCANAIDAILTGLGTDDHIAQLKQVADYCGLLLKRLEIDGSVADPDQLEDIRLDVARANEVVARLQQMFLAGNPIKASRTDAAQLLTLTDINDALDAVATRRQARDVMLAMITSVNDRIQSGARHVAPSEA